VDASCTPLGAGKLGIGTGALAAARPVIAADQHSGPPGTGEADDDGDGLPNAFDADDDGDGILDNDDHDSRRGDADGRRRFWVFSNFHQDMEHSLNANAMTVTPELIDAALVRSAGLAIQVAGGGEASEVRLDCGTLSYCTPGGTGRTREPYPDGRKFPEEMDPDAAGRGIITAGMTGDFQLAVFGAAPAGHRASEALRAGDVYLQRYTDDEGSVVEVPGMLNFVFHTTPAVKTVDTGVEVYTPVYPIAPDAPGTRVNPFRVPGTGHVRVTFTVWRPQRQGIGDAGEAPLMDMGNLRLVANLPNGPCQPGPAGCPDPGPGLCPGSVFTTDDPHLAVVPDGLQDSLGDRPADPAHTFTYTIDLSACVESVPDVTWDPGEVVMVPVQMMNVYGDNATQNVFFVRDGA
jgi:hypothetical protein